MGDGSTEGGGGGVLLKRLKSGSGHRRDEIVGLPMGVTS